MSEQINLALTEVHTLANAALLGQGFSAAQAYAIADTVTAAERDECLSHGLFRIPFYVKAGSNPDSDAQATPVLQSSSGSVVHVDGANGFCPLALETGLPELEKKATKNGIAAMAIHNVYNIAALWPEVEKLAQSGFVSFAFTAANAFVAPAGGIRPLFGTNPMAFGWPRANFPPLVFDQASSASARGEIQLHAQQGKPIPDGWAVDVQGNMTNDAELALQGAQLPFGGYKGSSLALMIELLAGALIGDLFSYESSEQDSLKIGAPFGGEFIIAIDPAHCVVDADPVNGQRRAETLFAKMLEQDGVRLPATRRYDARERTLDKGVMVRKDLHEQLSAFAA